MRDVRAGSAPGAHIRGPVTYRQALANRRFRLFALGFGMSSVGDGMSVLAVAWLAIEISSPAYRGLAVGAAVAAYNLPGAVGIFLRPLARFDSGRLLLLNCALRAACLGSITLLALFGRLEIVDYVALLAVSAILSSWGTAARYALVAEALPEDERLAGNSLVGALLNLGVIAGPAAAGFITAAHGAATVVAIDAASWVVFGAFVILAGPPREPAQPIAASGVDMRGALRMMLANRTVLGLLAVTLAFYFFYGPVEVALPVFVKQDLHQSAAVLGAYWTFFGAGAVAGGLAFGVVRRAPLFTVALLIIVGWGATLAVIPFAAVPIGIAAFTLGGLIWAPYPALTTTFLQQQASGRALTMLLAVWTSATMLATPLGTAAGGPLVAAIGAADTLLVSAIATLAMVPVVLVAKSIRNREAGRRPSP